MFSDSSHTVPFLTLRQLFCAMFWVKKFEIDLMLVEFFPNPQNPTDLEPATLSRKVCKLPLYKVVASN